MPEVNATQRLWDTIVANHADPELGDAAHPWEELPENMRGAIADLVDMFTEPTTVTGAAHDQVFVWRSPTDNDWHWHRVAANSEVISEGEGYGRKDDSVDGAKRANPDLADDHFHVEGDVA